MANSVATIEYVCKGDDPKEIADRLHGVIWHSPDDHNNIANGRPTISFTNTALIQEQTRLFKQRVKMYRKGDNDKTQLHFPLRFGQVTYMETLPTKTHLNMLFRHDSCVANNYDRRGDETGQHYQPQVYFLVKIDLATGTKTFAIVNSRFLIKERVFPHNDRGTNNIISGYCDGAYADQMSQALKEDNLSVFLSLFSIYITDGTQSFDEYGRSCRYFTKTAVCDNVNIKINNTFEATLSAFVFSDTELPHSLKNVDQQITITFKDKTIEHAYLKQAVLMMEKTK